MGMTKAKTPVVDADPKAIARWDNEGGAPASGDRSIVQRPRDNDQRAKFIVDVATCDAHPQELAKKSNKKHIVGSVGDAARTASLSAERRKEITSKAAAGRWRKGQAAPVKKKPA
jgi:hypothetical protein